MLNYDNNFTYNFLGQELILLPEKALYWKNKSILLLSDIHLGKASHFRKSGIPIPANIHLDDLMQVGQLVKKHDIKKLIFLGDLFHSVHNEDWDRFLDWIKNFPSLEIHLVKGNHDILPDKFYTKSTIIVHNNFLEEKPFIFTHIPLVKGAIASELYNIAGHIHPAVRLYGKGRQSLSLPCFYFGTYQAILPAFGIFTGKYPVIPEDSCKIFAIANNKIISIQNR